MIDFTRARSRATARYRFSIGLPNRPGRPDQQDQQHDGEGRHLRQRRIDQRADRNHLADQEARHQRALDAAEAADDHDHEDKGEHLEPHIRIDHDQRRMQAAGQAGQAAGDDEGDGEQPVDVDAEALDMLDVLDSGADRLADDGAVEEQPDADIDEAGNAR